jgi:prevent-host-death family protein
MSNKRIPFSEARQKLTAIIDEVQGSGKAVTIVRRGKPAAVLIDHATYEELVGKSKRRDWTLKGSIVVKPGVDLDKALRHAKQERIHALKARSRKLARLLRGT